MGRKRKELTEEEVEKALQIKETPQAKQPGLKSVKLEFVAETKLEPATPKIARQILEPNYNWRKVYSYVKLFAQAMKMSNGYFKHTPPDKYDVPQGISPTKQEKERFIVPTPIYLAPITTKYTSSPAAIPTLSILILPHEISLREHNSFMDTFVRHIKAKSIPYQEAFAEHVDSYAKNRLLSTLAEHDKWRAHYAPKLYIQIEDYLRAYIATQILFGEDDGK